MIEIRKNTKANNLLYGLTRNNNGWLLYNLRPKEEVNLEHLFKNALKTFTTGLNFKDWCIVNNLKFKGKGEDFTDLKSEIENFSIIVDTQEQMPYLFKDYPAHKVERKKLKTGDYSIKGYESQICVERKSISDFYGSIGHGRERLEAEFKRMALFDWKMLLIEDISWTEVNTPPPIFSFEKYGKGKKDYESIRKVTPATVKGTIFSWSQKFGVQTILAGNRQMGEEIVVNFFTTYLNKREQQLKDFRKQQIEEEENG